MFPNDALGGDSSANQSFMRQLIPDGPFLASRGLKTFVDGRSQSSERAAGATVGTVLSGFELLDTSPLRHAPQSLISSARSNDWGSGTPIGDHLLVFMLCLAPSDDMP